MSTEPEIPFQEIKSLAGTLIGRDLKTKQVAVLHGSCKGSSYAEIATENGLKLEYLNNNVGPDLWKALEKALETPVCKGNVKEVLEREWLKRQIKSPPADSMLIEIPEGCIDINSPFYINRPPIEPNCYRMVLQPGSLIRIRSPRKTGKTSLFHRILDHASNNGCKTPRVDLQQADKPIASLDKFLRWFCASISRQLNREPKLDDYWDEEIGSILSATCYFQEHFLEPLEQEDGNLVLGLDEIDWIFQYPDIAAEFLPLLRSWHEEAKVTPLWGRLRLVMAHSTEVNLSLTVDKSPFNVGLPVKLPEFTRQQVEELVQLHKLPWMKNEEINKMMEVIGGHPHLVRLALYNFACQSITLEQFLENAHTNEGIYQDNLRKHLQTLEKHPDLIAALKQVVMAPIPLQLDWLQLYQLESIGLVKPNGNNVEPSCELYRRYFSAQIF